MYYPAGAIKYAKRDSKRMCGDGCIEELDDAPVSPAMRAANVKFVDGAFTKWHYHTDEQLLLGTDGEGFVELQGHPIVAIGKGDRVLIPTGVWHRHGAAEKQTFGHLAVTSGETKWDDKDSCQRDARDAARLGMSIVTEITELNQRILKYEEAGAAEELAPLLSEAFIIVRSSGEKADRQAFLNAVPANANRGRSTTQFNVHLMGDGGLHTCIVTTTQNPDGTANPGRFWNTRLFVRENEQMRCMTWQVMKIRDD